MRKRELIGDSVLFGGLPEEQLDAVVKIALYVKGSRVGMGTSVPVVKLHMVQGDTPAVRLDQDGSSGWAPHARYGLVML